MHWSRYNRLFDSGDAGHYLYNALSNTLFELDEDHHAFVESLRQGFDPAGSTDPGSAGLAPESFEASATARTLDSAARAHSPALPDSPKTFLTVLRDKKVLGEPGEEEGILLARRYDRLAACFDSSRLSLTICPTLACNFTCPYCFESSQHDATRMSPETMDRLLAFIAGYKDIRHLGVAWYGGEPLLAFDTIRALTRRFKMLGLDYGKASLVTNGYLLDRDKIAQLNELNIAAIQITLDGPAEVHDRRRVLADGGPTFGRIMENVAALMASDYAGSVHIRVNIDKTNSGDFAPLRAALLQRYPGTKLSVYAGHVTGLSPGKRACDGCLDRSEWAEYTLSLYREHNLRPTQGFHPGFNRDSLCIATTHQGFVVGPSGELYKCWEDVGKRAMVIGTIHDENPVSNPVLRAQYACGTDAYTDPECLACHVLPLCGGGCANKRLRARHFGEAGLEYCSPYREHLVSYLEAYIDTVKTREIIAAVLAPHKAPAVATTLAQRTTHLSQTTPTARTATEPAGGTAGAGSVSPSGSGSKADTGQHTATAPSSFACTKDCCSSQDWYAEAGWRILSPQPKKGEGKSADTINLIVQES